MIREESPLFLISLRLTKRDYSFKCSQLNHSNRAEQILTSASKEVKDWQKEDCLLWLTYGVWLKRFKLAYL